MAFTHVAFQIVLLFILVCTACVNGSTAALNCVDKVPQCSNPAYSDVICKDDNNAILFCQKTCGKCPIDGGFSNWLPWTDCSVSCGGPGQTARVRTCDNPKPQNNGQNCQGKTMELNTCDNGPCSGSVLTFTSKRLPPPTSYGLPSNTISTTLPTTTVTSVASSASTPVPVTTKTLYSTTTPVSSASSPFPVTTSQPVCQDEALCSDPHMKLIACGDLYLSKNYCPKMCHLCRTTVTPPTCSDMAGKKCQERFFKKFTCADPGLVGLCRQTCGLCHI